jgi:hypothetical protein
MNEKRIDKKEPSLLGPLFEKHVGLNQSENHQTDRQVQKGFTKYSRFTNEKPNGDGNERGNVIKKLMRRRRELSTKNNLQLQGRMEYRETTLKREAQDRKNAKMIARSNVTK